LLSPTNPEEWIGKLESVPMSSYLLLDAGRKLPGLR
jgi:hypothetical protein